MNQDTITHWAARGWLLDPIVLGGLGEIVNTGNGPYYCGEQKESGYHGNAHPMFASRYSMGMFLGRPLNRSEILRFRSDNKKDLRLSNLILHSKQATSADLLKANGGPVLGYSHCLCGCGTELDMVKQKIQPFAYAEGHKPKSMSDPKNPKRARPPRQKVLVEKWKKELMPTSPLLKGAVEMPPPPAPEDSLKAFRELFEEMIHQLPWAKFHELLHLLLEIQTRKK